MLVQIVTLLMFIFDKFEQEYRKILIDFMYDILLI